MSAPRKDFFKDEIIYVKIAAEVYAVGDRVSGLVNDVTLATDGGKEETPGFYAALDSNNIVEIYEVNVTNASATAPTAVPIGNFKAKNVTSLDAMCDYTLAQTNILDATSWFAVVHIGGSGGCGVDTSTGDSWVLVTATTTTTLSITTTQFDEFYNPSGLLTGLVLNDPATNNIYLYANDSFTSPTKLFTGATTDFLGMTIEVKITAAD